jgi:serine/threonine protein kinase
MSDERDEGGTTEDEPSALREGAVIAPGYQVLEHLGRSRWLDIYAVWSMKRECRCIAKAPRRDRVEHPRPRHELLNEGRLLKRLSHPHIVRAYEVVREPAPVVILEALQGATLADVIKMRDRLPDAEDVAYLGLHLCSAMHYLHGQGYLHLDLKPANVINHFGVAKVIDLSNARRPGRARRQVGTEMYMSPEQILRRALTPATDVWGIGTVLFHYVAGRSPFEARNGNGHDQLNRRADPVVVHRSLPDELARAVDGCLEPDPQDRPTVAELGEALDGLTD